MKDLIKLYNIHSPSHQTEVMYNYLRHWLDEHHIEYNECNGNLYHFGMNEVILSAHMDQVQTSGQAVHFYLQDDDCIRGYNEDYEQTSLGADDKNGIWIIMKVLEKLPDTSFIISRDEEVGCEGIKTMRDILKENINSEVNFCLVLDRRGYEEVLDRGGQGKYCLTLAQDIANFIKFRSGNRFTVGSGSSSDTGIIRDYCEAVNLAVGYYNAHSSQERTNWEELKDTKDIVTDIVDLFQHYPCDPELYKEPERPSYYPGMWKEQTLW